MTIYNVTLNARALKASAMCASSEETRYYLKGVFVEETVAGVTLTATDGHRLAVLNHKRHGDDVTPICAPAVIVPLHMIDKLKIGKRAPDYATLTVDAGVNPAKLTLSYDGLSIVADAVDGTYPNARAVVRGAFTPDKDDAGKLAHFNPAYVAAFGKMKELLTGGKPQVLQIYHNGPSPAVVDFLGVPETDDGLRGFGVLMPCRAPENVLGALTAPPAWYDAPAPAASPSAADAAADAAAA
ncbi:MAG: hypothetical protein EBT13_14365 [Rhodobacteraceae bacterium]|nr:hypothetical protein [Paracoccaceae bacterium]